MTIPTVTPAEASALLAKGAVLVDIREPAERAREFIPGTQSVPLSRYDSDTFRQSLRGNPAPVVIFHCQGGRRTADAVDRLQSCGAEVYLLEGGLNAWKNAGFETRLDRSKPIELQRQVQIAAGSLVLAGLVSALLVSPWFFVVPAFVGSGLIFAGVTGWCGMAKLLAAMPWNGEAGTA